MLTAGQAITEDTHDIRVVQYFNTENAQGEWVKQAIVRSIDTTQRKRLGGPQAYTVKIKAKDGSKKITPDKEIQFYCNCQDFIFRRAYCAYEVGSLLIPEGFVLTPPEKTNPTCNRKVCKHISLAVRYFIETGK